MGVRPISRELGSRGEEGKGGWGGGLPRGRGAWSEGSDGKQASDSREGRLGSGAGQAARHGRHVFAAGARAVPASRQFPAAHSTWPVLGHACGMGGGGQGQRRRESICSANVGQAAGEGPDAAYYICWG